MKNIKILITEDDPNLGQILSEYLDLKGYQTVLCPDGEEGGKQFARSNFDLCILDLMMPKKGWIYLGKGNSSQRRENSHYFPDSKIYARGCSQRLQSRW